MKKNLLILSVLGLGAVQTGGAAEPIYQLNAPLSSNTNSSGHYSSSRNIYPISTDVVESVYKSDVIEFAPVDKPKDKPKEGSYISYSDTTNDELESSKYKSVTVMNNLKSSSPSLAMIITNKPSKNLKDSTVILSHSVRGLTSYCYRGCSLMVKFDDKEAKKYKFISDITGKIYILDSSHNKDFINNAKKSNVLKTKISSLSFNLPIEDIDFRKIDF